MLRLLRLRLEVHLEEAESRLLVRTDRRHIAAGRADHAQVNAVARERVAEERPDEGGTVAAANELRLADEEVDADGGAVERQLSRVVGMIADPVALELPDRPAVEPDEIQIGRVLPIDGAPVVGDRIVRIGLCRNVVVPPPDMWAQQPGPDELEILLAQRREREGRCG